MAGTINLLRKKARDANVSVTLRAFAKEMIVQSRKPTAGLRMRPSFFLIGAMKAGTTSLFNNLVGHPQIAEPISKEIRYFDFHYQRGDAWYLAHFSSIDKAKSRGETITGEASPSYIFDPHTPGRIRKFSPDAHLVMLLRNPADRAYSHYQHAVRYWGERRSFMDAVRDEERWMPAAQRHRNNEPNIIDENRIHHSYLARGKYLEQVERWDEAFGREKLLILRAEDYFEQPENVFPRVLEFLSLPSWKPKNFKRLNVATYRRLDDDVRKWLHDYFAEDNKALYDYLGQSFEWESHLSHR